MSKQEPISMWKVLGEQDGMLNQEIQAVRDYINNSSKLERKYKELLMVAMACVLRFNRGIIVHGKLALDYGATKDELFAAIQQSFLIGGIPVLREGLLAFKELFPD